VTHWFVPRLSAFNARFSEDLRFELIAGRLRGPAENVDLATRILDADDETYHPWDFAPQIIISVCSPTYLAAHGPVDHESDGAGRVFLQLTDTRRRWIVAWGMAADQRASHVRPLLSGALVPASEGQTALADPCPDRAARPAGAAGRRRHPRLDDHRDASRTSEGAAADIRARAIMLSAEAMTAALKQAPRLQ
jgi:hypothetical protein